MGTNKSKRVKSTIISPTNFLRILFSFVDQWPKGRGLQAWELSSQNMSNDSNPPF